MAIVQVVAVDFSHCFQRCYNRQIDQTIGSVRWPHNCIELYCIFVGTTASSTSDDEDNVVEFEDSINTGADQDTPHDPDDPTYNSENEILCPRHRDIGTRRDE